MSKILKKNINIIFLFMVIFFSSCASDNVDERPTILFFGDNLLAGPGLKEGERFPEIIQKKLDRERAKWRVINAGVSGDTLDDGLRRIEKALKIHQPKIVFLCLGINDYRMGAFQDINIIEKKLDSLISNIKARGSKVILAGIKLPISPLFWDNFAYASSMFSSWIKNTNEFIKLYAQIAAKHELEFVDSILEGIPAKSMAGAMRASAWRAGASISAGDLIRAFMGTYYGGIAGGLNSAKELANKFDLKKISLREFYQEGYFLDEVNPNAEGHRMISENIFTFLEPLLFKYEQ